MPPSTRGPLLSKLLFRIIGVPLGVAVRPAERVADSHATEKEQDDAGGQGDDDPRVNGHDAASG
jgi:hypothetical protein